MIKILFTESIIKKIISKNKMHIEMNQEMMNDDNQGFNKIISHSELFYSSKNIHSVRHQSSEKYLDLRSQFFWPELNSRRLNYHKLHSFLDYKNNSYEDFFQIENRKIKPIGDLKIYMRQKNSCLKKKFISINEIFALIATFLNRMYRKSFNFRKLIKVSWRLFINIFFLIKMFISNIFLIIITLIGFYLYTKNHN